MTLEKYNKALPLIQMGFIYAWLVNLNGTDSFYSVYVLCAFAGTFCIFDNFRTQPKLSNRNFWKSVLGGGVFAIATLLGNYTLFQPVSSLLNLFNMVLSLIGGFVIGGNVMICLMRRLPIETHILKRAHPVRLFWLAFAFIAVIDLSVFLQLSRPDVL